MGEKITLTLDERTARGKKVAKLRREGIVPAVVYGSVKAPLNVQVEVNIFEKIYKAAGKHSPVHLTLNGKKAIAMIKDVERHPVKGTPMHASFHAVKQNEPVVAEIPIHLVGEGESEAERNGLVVLQAIEKIEVKALPMDLPEALEVSMEGLAKPGDRITVADLKVPANVEIVDNDDGRAGTADDDHSVMDLVVANVYEPSALQAANDAAGGDAEDVSDVESENGTETPESEDVQVEEKQTNVDAK